VRLAGSAEMRAIDRVAIEGLGTASVGGNTVLLGAWFAWPGGDRE